MKKIIKVVLGLLVLGSIAYWGYRYTNATASLIGRIHIDAESVIKVGVHDLRETLVLDAIGSPGFYYDYIGSGGTKDSISKEKPDKGIDLMPYSLVLFSMENVRQTLFTTLPIDDYKEFEAYVMAYTEERSSTITKNAANTYSFAVFEKSKVALAWNETKVMIALSPKIDLKSCARIFKDVLVEHKTIQDKRHPMISTLKGASDHITYLKGKDRLGLNFIDGALTIDGTLFSDQGAPFPKEVHIETVPKASLQWYGDYNFANENHKQRFIAMAEEFSFFEKNNIEVAEIADRMNGSFSLAIAGKTVQTDTIVTYAYDDNFEKKEKRTLTTKEVPRIQLGLGSGEESLMDYLGERGAVNDQAVFKALPIFQFFVKEGGLTTSFGTFKGPMQTQKQVKSNFMGCTINFEQLQEDLNISQTAKVFGLLEKFDLRARQTEGNTIVVQGRLSGYAEDINIISQLFFGLNEEPVKEKL